MVSKHMSYLLCHLKNQFCIIFCLGSFIVYGLISFLGGIWLFFSLPETKGLSLEKITESFSIPSETTALHRIKNTNGPQELKSYGAISA